LLCDRAATTVAAAHCGWRGLAAGVLEAAVAAMPTPPAETLAWLGPAIGSEVYQVGDEVRAALTESHPGAEQAFVPQHPGKWLCNLYLIASQRLRRLGVAHIYGGGFCTYSDRERFFSYRRDGECGRMASLIWLTS
jgi:YfiH family protein